LLAVEFFETEDDFFDEDLDDEDEEDLDLLRVSEICKKKSYITEEVKHRQST
jgi:hypothetical protein